MFYVYRIIGERGETVYIGKGVRRRPEAQKRRFKSEGEILKEFKSELAAYNYERRQIAKHNPPLNILAGGGGSITRRRAHRRSKDEMEMQRLGTRVYTARMLLRFQGIEQYMSQEQMAMVRSVANGHQ